MGQIKLPDDFFFGAAMSGPQTEGGWQSGGKLENLWDTWSNLDIAAFHNRVGSYAGNDFGQRYEEDFELLASLGLTSVRTSIQWSRLLDQDGNINPQGEAFYHKIFAAAKKAGIEVFVNLYHFDMPTYLFRRGGWESREVVEAYADYAEKAFRTFGKEIRYWFTFNEPIVEPEQRYTSGECTGLPPRQGRRGLASGCKDWPHQLLHAALYEGESVGCRPRGRAHDGRCREPLVARPRRRRAPA